MGKKRTHAETKDGFTKPPPDKSRLKVPQEQRRKEKDKRKTGDDKRPKPALLFTPQPEWHAVELPELPTLENPDDPSRRILDEIHQHADKLLEAEAAEYATSHLSRDASHKFMSTVMASGTMEDKVSALTLLIQESPLHTQKAFEQLLGLSKKKNRSAALMALGALKDLLGLGVVLPPNRKLKAFARQSGLISAVQGTSYWKSGDKLPGSVQKVHLIAWAYEDWLKKQYFEMLKIIEGWGNDEVEYSRHRAVNFVWELLKEKPEQEENLLRLLVNKLGDKEKKVASKASYLLLQLQITHPLMKLVIMNAIESDLLFRPNQSGSAKYYAVITLNQTILSVREQEVANKLLEVYFSLFVALLKKEKDLPKEVVTKVNKDGLMQGGGGRPGKMAKKKADKAATLAYKSEDEMREKLISGVLSGVNRAFPFAQTDDAKFEKQLNTIFEITHSSNFNTSIQAMTLIQQISATKHYSTDRFYRTLYESLLDPRLITTSKHIMYLNLLFRSLKADVSTRRVKAFVKRLLQIIHMHEPSFICGVLYLVNELIKTFPSIKSMLSTPEGNDDDSGDEHYDDVPEEGTSTKKVDQSKHVHYDARKRDPDHAQADFSCLWELLPLQAHYHPSVHVLASRLLNQEPIKEKADPTIYTLMNFLDKFSFRNAKTKTQAAHGSSIMQPMAGTSKATDYLITARDGDRLHDPVNSEQFWRKKIDDVRVDEVFFHKYFEKAGKAKHVAKKEKKKRKQDEDEESDAGEDEIWKALVNSRPDVEGEDGDDDGFSDIDMDGMMSDDADDAEGGVGMDEGVELNLGSDDEGPAGAEIDDDDDEDDALDGLDLDDEDALVDSDDDVPLDMDMDMDMNDDTDVEDPTPSSKSKNVKDKGKDSDNGKKSNKKRKLKHLPTFASAEDYAKLIGGDDDDSE